MQMHYLITLSWNTRSGAPHARTMEGVVTAKPQNTRQDLVNAILTQAKTSMGANDSAVVTFLSLEPNEL